MTTEPWLLALRWLLSPDGPLPEPRSAEIRQPKESPWAEVDLIRRGVPVVEHRYAIWKRTGAVHRVQGPDDEYPEAVEDDPIWTPDAASALDI